MTTEHTQKIKSYQDLIVWQKAIILAKSVYRVTKMFPSDELYGMTSQMRRAVVAVSSNIAEGFGRRTPRDFAKFCSIAYSSAMELETQMVLAKELGYLKDDKGANAVESILDEVLRMLNSLIGKLRRRGDAR